MNRILAFFVIIALLSAGAIYLLTQNGAESSDDSGKVKIVASFYPLAHFAEQIGGDLVDVQLLTPPGTDPHTFEPSPRDVIGVRSADLFIYQGVGFDPWAEKLAESLQDSKVSLLQISDNISLSTFAKAGEQSEVDPHIWLDPLRASEVVAIIEESLRKFISPSGLPALQKNSSNYRLELSSLHKDFVAGLAACEANDIVVAHDAFGYLAERYGFNIISVSGLSPQDQPSAKRLGEIARLISSKNINYIFFESLTSPKLARTLAEEIGADTLILNPLEGLTKEQIEGKDDYISVMSENLNNLRTALSCE